MKYGPNTPAVERFIEQARGMTDEQAKRVSAAQDAAPGGTWEAARVVAWDAAPGGTWDAAREVAPGGSWDALLALLARDRISEEHFSVLYGPWASVFGWPE